MIPDTTKSEHESLAVLSSTRRAPQHRVRSHLLVRNATWLFAATVTTAGFGLAFWSVAARLFPVKDIGLVTPLVTAVSTLAYLSLVGLNSGLVRYLPKAPEPDRQVGVAFTVVGGASVILSVGYVLLLPLLAPRTALVFGGVGPAAVFVAVAVAAAVNLATDSVFIALREPRWNLVADGLVQGIAKLIPLAVLVAVGAVGLFLSWGIGAIAAVLVSLIMIRRALGLRFRPSLDMRALTGYLRFSSASYVSGALNLLPLFLLPLVVLDRLGPTSAAYFYVAFQVANLLGAIPFCIGESLFAEASHQPELLAQLARRSALTMVVVLGPAVAVFYVGAPRALAVFGDSYSMHAANVLRILCIGAVGVGFNTWSSFVLKCRQMVGWMIASNTVYLVAVVTFSLLFSTDGLSGVGWSWMLANVLSAGVAVVGLGMSPLRRWPRHADPARR